MNQWPLGHELHTPAHLLLGVIPQKQAARLFLKQFLSLSKLLSLPAVFCVHLVQTPVNIIIIAEMVLVVQRGAAGADEEWANDNTPTQKKGALKTEWKEKGEGIDFVVREYGT